MATNFLLHLTANGEVVSGESDDRRYPAWIEVIAYEWSGDRASASSSGSGRRGSVNMGNMVIRKRGDCATPLLFRAFTNNDICKGKLVLRKAGGEMEDYMEIHFDHASIVKFVQGNLAFGGEAPEEEVHFSYQTIRVVYDVQDASTGIVRGGIEHEYTIMGS
jgi:type VI secretion system secreted protein Hcp